MPAQQTMTIGEWGVIIGMILAVAGIVWRTAAANARAIDGLRSLAAMLRRESRRIDRLERRVFGLEPAAIDPDETMGDRGP